MEDDPSELLHEYTTFANSKARSAVKTSIIEGMCPRNWEAALSEKELEVLDDYMAEWQDKRGSSAPYDSKAVFSLSQSASGYATWTRKDGVLQCYTAGSSSRMWIAAQERWETTREKANSMMFPVFRETADAMGVPVIENFREITHERIGNSIHVGNLIALEVSILMSVIFLKDRFRNGI